MCSPLLEARSWVTFLSLTEERLRLIVLTIMEYVELTMWYWGREGGREEGEGRGGEGRRDEGREICSIVHHYLSTVGKNCFSFMKGVCYRVLGPKSIFALIDESKLEPCLTIESLVLKALNNRQTRIEVCSDSKNGWFLTSLFHSNLDVFVWWLKNHPILDE